MPLFLVFSPVLVPAGITATVLALSLMAGGTSGLTALTILTWLYKRERSHRIRELHVQQVVFLYQKTKQSKTKQEKKN
jgi:hypothetical protein